jgi:hypothetical protein
MALFCSTQLTSLPGSQSSRKMRRIKLAPVQAQLKLQSPLNAATGIVTPDQIAANKALLDAGMTLIYASCNDFFTREGARHKDFRLRKA